MQQELGLPSKLSWESASIDSVTPISVGIVISTETPILKPYSSVNGVAQFVKVPEYPHFNLGSGNSITAPAWDGSTGGVIAFRANNTARIAGTISVNGLGFRGGSARQ